MKHFSLLHSKASSLAKRLMVISGILMLGITQVWGATGLTKSDSYTFSSAVATGWEKVGSDGTNYCGGWGCKNSTPSFTVRTSSNITKLTDILSSSSYQNFSLEVVVSGLCNGGTNTCTVTLLNSSNTKVGSLEETKTNELGSGAQSQYAEDVTFTFTPTSSVARIQVQGGNKCAIYSVSYTLTYDDKPASCSNNLTVTKTAPTNGSFLVTRQKIFHHIIMSMFTSRNLKCCEKHCIYLGGISDLYSILLHPIYSLYISVILIFLIQRNSQKRHNKSYFQ